MQKERFSIQKRIHSFRYAFAGFKVLFRAEQNAWIHATAAGLAILAGFLFRISPSEWLAVIIVIGMVFAAEILNTALEHTADFMKEEYDERIRDIKDLSAAAVLVCAITALGVGILIFLPKIIHLITSLLS